MSETVILALIPATLTLLLAIVQVAELALSAGRKPALADPPRHQKVHS